MPRGGSARNSDRSISIVGRVGSVAVCWAFPRASAAAYQGPQGFVDRASVWKRTGDIRVERNGDDSLARARGVRVSAGVAEIVLRKNIVFRHPVASCGSVNITTSSRPRTDSPRSENRCSRPGRPRSGTRVEAAAIPVCLVDARDVLRAQVAPAENKAAGVDGHRPLTDGRGPALTRIQLPPRIQVVKVHYRIEHQRIRPHRLPTIDRVDRKEHDVPLLQRRIDDGRPLRDVVPAAQQP
jgi:hypothetical protein